MESTAAKLATGLGFFTIPAAGLLLYHEIVRRKVRNNFVELSAGNYEHVLVQMAPHFDHHFAGAHPLGGRRHTVAAMRRWFERLYRLTPNLSFEILGVSVSGTP